MIRLHIIISGHVQHCGFRYFTWKMSKKVGNLTGWVKNGKDGNVEMEVQGIQENIDIFLSRVEAGSGNIRVDKMDIDEIEVVEDEQMYQVVR